MLWLLCHWRNSGRNKEWRQQKDSSRLFYINLFKTAQDNNEQRKQLNNFGFPRHFQDGKHVTLKDTQAFVYPSKTSEQIYLFYFMSFPERHVMQSWENKALL